VLSRVRLLLGCLAKVILAGLSRLTGDKITISDLANFTNPVDRNGTSPGDTYFDRRWDLRPGTTVGAWIGVSNMNVVSTQNPVPMYGVRAYGFFSVCSAHPVYGD
jgi:hypothetical protein